MSTLQAQGPGALRFFYNGLKDGKGKLQLASYCDRPLVNFPAGTITIYARTYAHFSPQVAQAFNIENGSDIMTDYFEKDRIRVEPTHPLYGQVQKALQAQKAHMAKRARKYHGSAD